MLSRVHYLLLRDLLGERLHLINPTRSASRRRDAWRGYIDGIDAAFIAEILALLDAQSIDQLWVDGSNYGAAIAAVKQARPRVRIVTFFHNVEARFFWGSLRVRRNAKALAVLVANYIAERGAVRHSDVLVTLSKRDSAGLRRLYGRGADAILPMVVEDGLSSPPSSPDPSAKPYLLFVGGGFYANIEGIRWFARDVAPWIDTDVKVVGRDMESQADAFAGLPKVELVGTVDDLAPWYADAALVLAPIFDGSGMKTKVAEALMHGKHVVGAPEAFSGYADDIVAANTCCTDAGQWVSAINRLMGEPPPVWDAAMRSLYERDHSPAALRGKISAILALDHYDR